MSHTNTKTVHRGIGLSIVQRLAQSSPKDQIVLTSRTTASATAAIDHLRKLNLGANVSSLELDVTDDQSIESAAATMRDRFGKVDGAAECSQLRCTVLLTPG